MKLSKSLLAAQTEIKKAEINKEPENTKIEDLLQLSQTIMESQTKRKREAEEQHAEMRKKRRKDEWAIFENNLTKSANLKQTL